MNTLKFEITTLRILIVLKERYLKSFEFIAFCGNNALNIVHLLNIEQSKKLILILWLDPQAPIVNQSPDFVKWGTKIKLTCVARSYLPVDTAYLIVENEESTRKIPTTWENRKRVCPNNDYDGPDCVMETSFDFNVEVLLNGQYRCGYEKAESKSVPVKIMVTSKRVKLYLHFILNLYEFTST